MVNRFANLYFRRLYLWRLKLSLAIFDGSIPYRPRSISIGYRCLGALSYRLDLLFNLAHSSILDSAWWAICNLVDVSQGEDVADSRGAGLDQHGGRAFEAEE